MCDFGCWIWLCHRVNYSLHDVEVAKKLVERFEVSVTNFTCMWATSNLTVWWKERERRGRGKRVREKERDREKGKNIMTMYELQPLHWSAAIKLNMYENSVNTTSIDLNMKTLLLFITIHHPFYTSRQLTARRWSWTYSDILNPLMVFMRETKSRAGMVPLWLESTPAKAWRACSVGRLCTSVCVCVFWWGVRGEEKGRGWDGGRGWGDYVTCINHNNVHAHCIVMYILIKFIGVENLQTPK